MDAAATPLHPYAQTAEARPRGVILHGAALVNDDGDALRAALEERVRFERLIGDLSSHFVSLAPDEVDAAIEDAQRRVVEALDLDRSTLFQRRADGSLEFTHYWSRPEFPPPPAGVLIPEAFPWCLGRILRGEVVCFSSVDDLPPGVADRDTMKTVGVHSNVTIPLLVAGEVVGALAFGSLRTERPWPEAIVNRLSLLAQVFANALARKRADLDLRRALEENARLRDHLVEENVYLQHEVKALHGASPIAGQSVAIRSVLSQIDHVAPTAATVLLLGETGTGKELLATAIHDRSPRQGRAMVRVNCGAIPATLLESELFGREKGAYTGALARQTGRFELADGSTIFLDEIGELTNEAQVKLLRVLQEREIERLGSSRPIKVDVRVIAATNRDLEQAIADGAFREDLYYRLNVFPITVPPLRERPEDIPLLVWTFVDEFSKAMGKRIDTISKEHLVALRRYPWPGNVRELRNVVERAVIVSTSPQLAIQPPAARRPPPGPRGLQLADAEREHIRHVLEKTAWRIRGDGGAAELLDMKPSTLEGRMQKLGLHRPGRV
jgi:formate hydrogenlyase transcriptional activator